MRIFQNQLEQHTQKNVGRLTFLSMILPTLLYVPAWSQADSSTSEQKIQQAPPEHPSIFVSMIQLIANPVKYNHKYVEVEGYLTFLPNPYYPQKEVDPKGVLYLTKEHADYKMAGNTVCLGFTRSSGTLPDCHHFDKKHVVVAGLYRHSRELEDSHFPNAILVSSIRSLEKGPTSDSESP